jgi:hypothetical protein
VVDHFYDKIGGIPSIKLSIKNVHQIYVMLQPRCSSSRNVLFAMLNHLDFVLFQILKLMDEQPLVEEEEQ